ncbi:putative nuclease HARBI1 [Bacillus rossius redtenbacheri]|uniref:putative nuclease HARBI1 n=1 Tax=Bacillus rossius redtenbacheri TaxID=93214 RepID=UPI002FDD9214
MPAPSRTTALSVETKVLSTLRFYAGGPYQSNVGQDVYTAMHQSSVSRSISEVTNAINQHLFRRWVRFDLNPASTAALKEMFFKYGFPGVIGAIDGTHVAIVAPPVDDPVFNERAYFNYKRYHSINVQLVCDANMKILNVNSRYPGATNDSFIYANCSLRQGLHEMLRQNQNAWLLGDSGYPLEPCLMTPFMQDVDPLSPQGRYNQCLRTARSIIEQCNGLLKSRWRCLLKHRVLHYKPDQASRIVNACTVLHNMCLQGNVQLPDELLVHPQDLGMDAMNEVGVVNQNFRAGQLIRQRIIDNYFM